MAMLNGIELIDPGNIVECFATECVIHSVGSGCSRATFYVPKGSFKGAMMLEAVIHIIIPTDQLKKIGMQMAAPPREIGGGDDDRMPAALN